MDALIQQFRKLGYRFSPPCTGAQIKTLETAISYPLNATLTALYGDHNGMQWDDHTLPFRLMSVEEVIQLYRNLQGNELYWMIPETVHFFWAEGNVNYAGLYIGGPLSGKICFLDHEDPDLSPVFRSIHSFYESLLSASLERKQNADADWQEMSTDYPLFAVSLEHDEADLALALHYLSQFEATPSSEDWYARKERCYLGLIAMNLLPFGETKRLLPFLKDSDMWIQARAGELLGKRRYEAAIPLLAEIAVNGTHNGRLAAIGALGKMATLEAKAQLLQLAPRLEGAWKGELSALKYYGCDFRRVGDAEVFQYREPGSSEWIDL